MPMDMWGCGGQPMWVPLTGIMVIPPSGLTGIMPGGGKPGCMGIIPGGGCMPGCIIIMLCGTIPLGMPGCMDIMPGGGGIPGCCMGIMPGGGGMPGCMGIMPGGGGIPGCGIDGMTIPGGPIPIPGGPIPGGPIPGCPIPGGPIPGCPIPGCPIPGGPTGIMPDGKPIGDMGCCASPGVGIIPIPGGGPCYFIIVHTKLTTTTHILRTCMVGIIPGGMPGRICCCINCCCCCRSIACGRPLTFQNHNAPRVPRTWCCCTFCLLIACRTGTQIKQSGALHF